MIDYTPDGKSLQNHRVQLLVERTSAGFRVEIDEIIIELRSLSSKEEIYAVATKFEFPKSPETISRETVQPEIPKEIKQKIKNEIATAQQRIADAISKTLDTGSTRKIDRAKFRFDKAKRVLQRTLPLLVASLLYTHAGVGHQNPENIGQRANAQSMLKTIGSTQERVAAYVPGVSELLYFGIVPFGYQNIYESIKNIPENILNGIDGESKTTLGQGGQEFFRKWRRFNFPEREDAWRMYLGLPQVSKTFKISNYRPSKSRENKYYYAIDRWLQRQTEQKRNHLRSSLEYMESQKEEYQKTRTGGLRPITGRNLENAKENAKRELAELSDATMMKSLVESTGKRHSIISTDRVGKSGIGIMGDFTLTTGQDEHGNYISYHDKWDLANNQFEGIVGKPFEIYDRIYYSPTTFEPIE